MKKMLMFSVVLLALLVGCQPADKVVQKGVPSLSFENWYSIDYKKFGLTPARVEKLGIVYENKDGARALIQYNYPYDDEVECSDFSFSVKSVEADMSLVDELKEKITCDDITRRTVVIPLIHFKHISQNWLDTYQLNESTFASNFMFDSYTEVTCSKLNQLHSSGIADISECEGGNIVEAMEAAFSKPNLEPFQGGSFVVSQFPGDPIYFIKQCSESNYIQVSFSREYNIKPVEEIKPIIEEFISKNFC